MKWRKSMLVVLALNTVALSSPVHAQDEEMTAIEDISLEDLLNTRLSARNVYGIHHTHPAGEWMASFTGSFMIMDGNRAGSSRVSTSDVLVDFPVAPTDMSAQMYSLGLMYGIVDDVTVMAMLPFKRLSMSHVTRMGGAFTTESQGFGDTQLSALYTCLEDSAHIHRIHVSVSTSLPTGSIDARDDLPIGDDMRLPYPMQLGSGTFDLGSMVTYLGANEHWDWGVHAGGTFRLGENSNDYRLGHRLMATVFGGYEITEWLNTSIRFDFSMWGHVVGADPQLMPAMVPTADPSLRGGRRLRAAAAVNANIPDGALKGLRILLEAGVPVYQNLDGPQLEVDYGVTMAVEYTNSF